MAKKIENLAPINYVETLKERKIALERAIKLKKYAIEHSNLPVNPGHIRIVPHGRVLQFYLITKKSDTIGKYLPREKNDFARSVIKLDYEKKAVKTMEKELLAIKKLLIFAEKKSVENIFKRFSKVRKPLVEPVTLSDEEYAKQWQSVSYVENPFAFNETEFVTCKGERVRSKSEVIIADTLARNKIPYRYEFPLELKNLPYPVYPDFCCLNLPTRKEIYWEHFGMMDDSDYAAKAIAKIRRYEENGIIAGKNAIFTFESAEMPVSTIVIEKLLEKVFV